jgi:hypothetical protein
VWAHHYRRNNQRCTREGVQMILLRLLIVGFCLFLPTVSKGAIAYVDAAQGTSTTNSVTFAYTTAAGSQLCMDIGVAAFELGSSGAINTLSTLAYNGDSATPIGGTTAGTSEPLRIEKWKLVNPDTGVSGNVVATWNASPTLTAMGVSVVVMSGCDQSTTNRALASSQDGSAGTTQPDITATSVTGDLCVDNIISWFYSTTAQADAGQTIRVDQSVSQVGIGASTESASGVSTAMGWTKTSGDYHAYVGACYIPSAAVAAPKRMTMMGVGG